MKQMRSDDYFDGLQVAYKLVFNIQQKAVSPETKRVCNLIMGEINKAIDDATEDKPRIIIP